MKGFQTGSYFSVVNHGKYENVNETAKMHHFCISMIMNEVFYES